MRPEKTEEESKLHECYDCGARVHNPDQRFCTTCGGEMRNIGRARDL